MGSIVETDTDDRPGADNRSSKAVFVQLAAFTLLGSASGNDQGGIRAEERSDVVVVSQNGDGAIIVDDRGGLTAVGADGSEPHLGTRGIERPDDFLVDTLERFSSVLV
jgi:hypothetical protein